MRFLLAVQALVMLFPAWGGAQTAQPAEWPVAAGSRIRIQSPILGDKIGAVTGAAIGAATYEPCEGFCVIDFERGGTALLSGTLGAGVGTVVGVLVGLRRVDNWVAVRLR
jgi:hypothetical protein